MKVCQEKTQFHRKFMKKINIKYEVHAIISELQNTTSKLNEKIYKTEMLPHEYRRQKKINYTM